jgi:hypothetical protein
MLNLGLWLLCLHGSRQLLDTQFLHDLVTAEVNGHDETALSKLLKWNLESDL